MTAADFDPWAGICGDGQAAFVDRYLELFDARMSRKKGGLALQSCVGGGDPSLECDSKASTVVVSVSHVASGSSVPAGASLSSATSFR